MPLSDKNQKRLEALLSAFDDGAVQPEELVQAIEAVMQVVESGNLTLVQELNKATEKAKSDKDELERRLAEAQSLTSTAIEQLRSLTSSDTTSLRQALTAELRRIEALIPELPPEFDASDIYEALEGQKTALTALQELVVGENVRNALEALPEGDKLAIDAIEGLRERLEELAKRPADRPVISGGITRALVQQMIDASPSQSGSITVETPGGTVDDSNLTFTVTTEPKYIVVNGAQYFAGAGYTYLALTITLNNPVGTGGFIRSVY